MDFTSCMNMAAFPRSGHICCIQDVHIKKQQVQFINQPTCISFKSENKEMSYTGFIGLVSFL